MDWLNYHHLLYFWTVAKEGSVSGAARKLHLAQPTISGQLRQLEKAIGEKLYERRGRRLVLTDTGQLVFEYAEEIFSIGRELTDLLAGRAVADRPVRLRVGVPGSLPKLVAYRLLEPAFLLPDRVHVYCEEARLETLLAQLAVHDLDVVLSDRPADSLTSVRAFNHPLGECGVAFYGTDEFKRSLARRFPQSLNASPMLLPVKGTALRRSLDVWFDENDVHPEIVGEFEDMAMLKVFAQAGMGVVPAPAAFEKEIRRQYGVVVIGRADAVRESFFAITVDRRIKHPAVVAISENARQELFAESKSKSDIGLADT